MDFPLSRRLVERQEPQAVFARAFCRCVLVTIVMGRVAMAQPTSPPASTPVAEGGRESPLLRSLRSLALSGFAAGQSTAHSVPGESTTLSALELDAGMEFGSVLQGALALVRDGSQVAMAVGFFDVHVGGGLIAPRGAIFAEKGMHLQAGRFDLPFGADWQRFATIDRALISPPAITDLLADGGLNSDGVRAFSVGARWNASAWLVKGGLAGRAIGARVALTPFSNPFVFKGPSAEKPLEIGLSTHLDGRDGSIVDRRTAVDIDMKRGDFDLSAEWQDRRVLRDVQGLTTGVAHGWHVATEVPVATVGPVGTMLLARYEAVDGDALGTDGLADATSMRRAVAGARLTVGERLIFKSELGWRIGVPTPDFVPVHSWLLEAVFTW